MAGMTVIVSGANRIEFCKVKKKKDFDRRFFRTRGQTYFIPVNGLVRMRIIEYGKERESEATIIYPENSICPYHQVNGIEYSMDNLLNDIDRYKQMTNYSWWNNNKPWFMNTGKSLWKYLTSTGGIVVIVLLYVFLSGGLHA